MESSLLPDGALGMLEAQTSDTIQRKLEMDRLRADLKNTPDQKAKLREACEGFESIFIQKIWEQMRNNVPQSGYLHSREERMYQGMYDQEFAKKMTSAGGIGLADMLYEQLSRRTGGSGLTNSPRRDPSLPIIPAGSSPSSRLGNSARNLQSTDHNGQNMPLPEG